MVNHLVRSPVLALSWKRDKVVLACSPLGHKSQRAERCGNKSALEVKDMFKHHFFSVQQPKEGCINWALNYAKANVLFPGPN